jgi:hypothetical protein
MFRNKLHCVPSFSIDPATAVKKIFNFCTGGRLPSVPGSWILCCVILLIPHAGLAQMVASPVLLAQAWPAACGEVMMLIHVLRMSVPSLADALAVGLVTMLTPPGGAPSPLVSLAYQTAVLTAVAGGQSGDLIDTPHLRANEVRRLEVTDLVVGGRSGLRLAG